MTNDEAELAAIEWEGEAGGVLLPQLTANELAGIVNDAVAKEREACAMACEGTGERPSSLWEEPGCWTQASETCAFAIRMRSNAEVNGAGTASAGLPGSAARDIHAELTIAAFKREATK